MSKLYPPIVETSLPAIYAEDDNIIITVPFHMNPTVGKGDVIAEGGDEKGQVSIMIKTIATSTLIGTFTTDFTYNNSDSAEQIAILSIAKNSSDNALISQLLIPGQYYKIQLAFINRDNEIGYYSSVGIAKYVHECVCRVKMTQNDILYECLGEYECQKDSSEKVYSYNFTLKEESTGNIVATSGTLLHNINNDTETNSSIDTWRLTKILKAGKYILIYTIHTINGLTKTINEEFTEPNWAAGRWLLSGALDKDNGCISLSIDGNNTANILTNGAWTIGRSSNKDPDNIIYLNTINKSYAGDKFIDFFQDYTIEQGVTYKYYVYHDHLGVQCSIEPVDYEHMFLFDGERQLCIKYNPKVTSFKSTILENKVDTIGGKYPFFFRNGNVGYKEFSISGLISGLMDEGTFIKQTNGIEAARETTPASSFVDRQLLTTALESGNIYQERLFKTEVLEWLNNGKPKLFRSPTEGNFIVRLMNVSLSPNDTLGRMLHTFNCTAYEIADCTEDNLRIYGFYSDKWKVNENAV